MELSVLHQDFYSLDEFARRHQIANLGSLEVGKFGDVVVLSDDYFNEVRVPDVRKLYSVLTVVDGKVVHSLLKQ